MNHLEAEIARLGPWVTRFDFAGKTFGGTYDALNDDRVSRLPQFFSQCRRILEVGCLEGGHTVILSRAYPTAEIVAIDGKPENLAKAKFLTSLYGCRKVSFGLEDLETADLSSYGRFEAVVCLGLLYHLEAPWTFLSRVSAQTDAMYIWTVVCSESEAVVPVGKYRGRIFLEGDPADPRTALRKQSFFPTLGSLVQMLRDASFLDFRVLNFETTPNGPSVTIVATKQPYRL
ncbi:MAG: class SAM-dependent methyltransferase [Verrucomicrobia bacterium]|nr:class SAM-dependent methyltransferase [Verrucomicrobiota bacterium]